MATADDDTQTAPPPDAAPAATPDMLGQALQLAQQYGLMPQMPQRDTTPVSRSWTSLLGEALGGGPPVSGMTDAEKETAGHHALMNFGTGLMAASRYSPGQTIFSNLAQGFQGAQRGEIGSEQLALQQLGAQQGWAQQQAQNRVEAIKAALPFLRLQAAQGMPNPLAGGGGGTDIAKGGSIADVVRNPSAGTAGQQGNNPGNIMADGSFMPVGAVGAIPVSGGRKVFAFPDIATGVAAHSDLLNNYASQGINTVADAVKRWVGDPKADTTSYAADIASRIGVKPTDKIDLTDPKVQSAFIMAQQPHESGKPWLSQGAVDQGIALAQTRRQGGKPAPTATATATPPAASTAPSGVQMGGPPPAPPGGSGAPATGGIGTALNPPLPTPLVPPVAVKGSPLPAGKLQTTGKPPGVADIIQGGMKLAQATPVVPGTVQAAGPAAGTPPAASVAWGPSTTTTIGDYNTPSPAPAATTTQPAQPAPQPSTQAQQPPAPPPVTTPPAGGPLTFEQFQQQHPITIDPSTYAVTPPNLADAIAAKNSAALTLDRIHKGLSTADENKATQAFTDASQKVAQLQQEAQSKSLELQQAAQKNALDTQRNLYDQEMQRQQEAKLKADELAQTVAENEKNRQAQINLENVKAGVATSQHLQEAYNTDAANSGKRIDDLELLRGLSDNAGSPTMLTSIKVGDRSLADIISGTGFGGKDLQDKVGAIQAFRAGILNTVRELRTGGAATGEPRSNQDLQFVQDMAPNEWQSPATRGAIISFLQQVNQRRIDMAAEVSRLMATRGPGGQLMPAGEAVAQARKNLPDFVPTMPPGSLDNSPTGLAARKDFFSSIPPHSFFRYPNGRIDLYNGPGG